MKIKTIQSVNPYSGEKLITFTLLSQLEIVQKIEKANAVYINWQKEASPKAIEQRAKLLLVLADRMAEGKLDLAEMMTKEMGKPITQSIGEIDKCIWLCKYYAEQGGTILQEEMIETDASQSLVRKEGLGVILGVMPWNFPFWQVFRFAVPTILVGNTVLLKHSSLVSGCALAMEELFLKAGFEVGSFQTLLISSSQVGTVVEHPAVRGVSLTGSEGAGRSVAALCGQYLKPSLLELGGNNAALILNDADLDKYIDTMVWARFQNAGQSCIASKRFIVFPGIYDRFLDRFVKATKALKIGDPMSEDTQMSTLCSESSAIELAGQVEQSIAMGGRMLLGGKRKEAFYPPTIIDNVKPGNPAFEQELFGPVAAIIQADDWEHAIDLVNQSSFGLGVSIYTSDTDNAMQYIPRFNEGAVFINEMVKSDPRLPFGGVKNSGYGRELGEEGLLAFVNKKTVYIK